MLTKDSKYIVQYLLVFHLKIFLTRECLKYVIPHDTLISMFQIRNKLTGTYVLFFVQLNRIQLGDFIVI